MISRIQALAATSADLRFDWHIICNSKKTDVMSTVIASLSGVVFDERQDWLEANAKRGSPQKDATCRTPGKDMRNFGQCFGEKVARSRRLSAGATWL